MRALALSVALGLAAPALAAGDPPPAVTAATDELTRRVVALRGLKQKRPIARGVLSREQIGQKLRERADADYTDAEVEAETRVLRRLGLLPVGTDYKKLLVDLLLEKVAGFYDPRGKHLYVADWLALDQQRPTLAHELEHALQDQSYDLAAFTRPLKDDGDRQLARSALVEGDATATMLELEAQALRLPPDQLPDLVDGLGDSFAAGPRGTTPVFDRAPPFVRTTLLFPYLDGLRFVMALRRGHGWKRVDQAWKLPPASTEQVLHPDRYLVGDAPVAIEAAPLVTLAPRTELRRDVLGELVLRTLFRSRLPASEADVAAAGWGGDRLVAYAAGRGEPVVLDLSVWDTEADAREAQAAFVALVGKLTGQRMADQDGVARVTDPNGDLWRVERRAGTVLVVMGAPANEPAIAAEAWDKLRPTP